MNLTNFPDYICAESTELIFCVYFCSSHSETVCYSKSSSKLAKSEPISVSSGSSSSRGRGRPKEGSVSPSISASPSNPWSE